MQAMEYKMKELYVKIGKLADEDKKIVEDIKASSGSLGELMAHGLKRKVAIDTKYMSEAVKFEQELKNTNEAAAKAYAKARSAEAKAA